jgi:Arginosuccinate synthase
MQGNVIVVGRKSPYSLYNQQLSSFEDDAGAYDQTDAAGFIKLQALRCAAPCAHPCIKAVHCLVPVTLHGSGRRTEDVHSFGLLFGILIT